MILKKTAIDFFNKIIEIKSYNIEGKIECSKIIGEELKNMGFAVKVYKEYGSPIILAHYYNNCEKSILFYSHYDVKPEGNIHEWKTNPFIPYYDYENGRVYARGTGDAKGQIFAIMEGIRKAIEDLRKINYNITVLYEGDEESNSVGLEEFCKKELSNDIYESIIVNDSHWLDENPVIFMGNRGQMDIKLVYTIPEMIENYHAGNYGGIEQGAARTFIPLLDNILSEIESQIRCSVLDEGYGNAISLTYISAGDEKRSVIPKQITAKIDVRYIEDNIPNKVIGILGSYAYKNGIEYQVMQNESGYYNTPNKDFLKMMKDILDDVTKKKTMALNYCGAYLPIKKLASVQGTKYVIPIAQADECNHAPNENISFENIQYGINFVKELLCSGK